MAELNFQFGNGKAKTKAGDLAGRIFLCLFATPFAGFGVFAFWSAIKKLSESKTHDGLFLLIFGVVFSAVGFGLMYAAITAGRRQKAAEEKWAAQTDGGKKVWLARDDWAAGKIKSNNLAQGMIFLIMGAAFSSIGGISTFFVVKQELPKGNYAALLVLLFPLVGVAFLGAFVRGMLAQRRFGECWFELAQVPAPLGGSLDGLIQTERPLVLEQGLNLKISCIRRTVSGSGKNRHTHENILWQDEKVFRADATLPTVGLVGSGIPVHFNLPAEQPESSLRGDSTVIWRLEARAKMAGPDFTAMFEVPVFQFAGMAAPKVQKESDPAASLLMTAEEIRRDENSKIQVNQVPDGVEFYFPAARNPGTAFGLTLFLFIWIGISYLFFGRKIEAGDLIILIPFGLAWVLIFIWCLHLWFKSCRIVVNSTGVQVLKRLLIFKWSRHFSAGDVASFNVIVGMTSGNKTDHDIKIVTHAVVADNLYWANNRAPTNPANGPVSRSGGYDPRGVTISSGIASKAEADWLVREMNRALGRKI